MILLSAIKYEGSFAIYDRKSCITFPAIQSSTNVSAFFADTYLIDFFYRQSFSFRLTSLINFYKQTQNRLPSVKIDLHKKCFDQCQDCSTMVQFRYFLFSRPIQSIFKLVNCISDRFHFLKNRLFCWLIFSFSSLSDKLRQ